MPEELIIRHGSPTLAGLKTANLFTCMFDSEEETIREIRRLNQILVPKRTPDSAASLYERPGLALSVSSCQIKTGSGRSVGTNTLTEQRLSL